MMSAWRHLVCGNVFFNNCSMMKSSLYQDPLTKKNSKELIVGKERMKELVLEEDVECGCQCAGISATHCAGHFNEVLIRNLNLKARLTMRFR